jgi:hypothetical protein
MLLGRGKKEENGNIASKENFLNREKGSQNETEKNPPYCHYLFRL